MKSSSNVLFRKFLFRLVSVGLLLSILLGMPALPSVRAQAPTGKFLNGSAAQPFLSAVADPFGSLKAFTTNSLWYVATTGDDGNDCLSTASPCQTIQAAIDKAASGDTVIVAAGTYQENLIAKDGVNLTGAGMFATIVDAGGIKKPLYVPPFVTTTIQSMAFTNSGTDYDDVDGLANAGVVLYMANATLIHCRVNNNNFFSGILSLFGTNTFAYNLIDHNTGYGVFLSAATVSTVQNNTIVGNTSGGIAIFSTPEITATILNSILASNSGYGIDLPAGPGAAYSIDYNDFWDNASGSVVAPLTLGTGNLALDPKFKSAGTGDYTLLEDSPVIDLGDPAAQYNDLDGTRNDMGAFPFLRIHIFLPLVIR